jgi:hypothetical protein
MHNSPKENMEFRRQWCTTNLRYMLGGTRPFDEKTEQNIAFMRSEIERAEKFLSEQTK